MVGTTTRDKDDGLFCEKLVSLDVERKKQVYQRDKEEGKLTMRLRPMISKIFSEAKTNSISPYTRTKSKLAMTSKAPNRTIHAAAVVLESQNDTMTAAAVNSAGTEMMLLYMEFHPWANERAGSTKYSACRMMAPLRGTRALERDVRVRIESFSLTFWWDLGSSNIPELSNRQHDTHDEDADEGVSEPVWCSRRCQSTSDDTRSLSSLEVCRLWLW